MRIALHTLLLAAALSATLGGQTRTPARSRVGARAPLPPRVTFNNQIVRLFQEKCQVCHHPGEVAPFSLMDWENAWLFSPFIQDAVESRYMPPWKPVEGEFHGDRSLTPEEIALISEWVDLGAPEGDPRDLPEPLVFSKDWTLGEPDLILELPADYQPDADVADDYRCFSLPTGLTEQREIEAIEVRPGNRQVVHHVILFPDPFSQSVALEAAQNDGQPGYTCYGDPGFDTVDFMGGWAPGNRPQQLPAELGQPIAANGRIALQVHYHPDGLGQTDRTRVGLHFRDTPAEKQLLYLPLVNQDFLLPAGEKRAVVTAEFQVPSFLQATVYSLLPHMHLVGREIQLEVTIDGKTETVIRIDDWDFDWQDTYWLKDPLFIPPGSTLKMTAIYDNSADNPRNPNTPPVDLQWGDGSEDEMALIFIGFTQE